MSGVRNRLRRQRDDEADNLVEFRGHQEPGDLMDIPGGAEPDDEVAREFQQERNRKFLRVMEFVAWTAGISISAIIVLLTVLTILTYLHGGVVPVGTGTQGQAGIAHDLSLFFTEGVSVAVTIGVMVLALAALVLLIPWMRRKRGQ